MAGRGRRCGKDRALKNDDWISVKGRFSSSDLPGFNQGPYAKQNNFIDISRIPKKQVLIQIAMLHFASFMLHFASLMGQGGS